MSISHALPVRKALAFVFTCAALAVSPGVSGSSAPTPTSSPPAPTAKALDPIQEAVLIGRSLAEGMIIQLELEPAQAMWMQMGTPPMWMEQPVAPAAGLEVESVRGAIFYPPVGLDARLLAGMDGRLGHHTTLGAAFIAVAGTKPGP